jgi:hypothetical protein
VPTFANASDLPIYDVRVDFYHSPPNGTRSIDLGQAGERVVPPGEIFLKAPDSIFLGEEKDQYVVSVALRDAANRRWRREPDGTLVEA